MGKTVMKMQDYIPFNKKKKKRLIWENMDGKLSEITVYCMRYSMASYLPYADRGLLEMEWIYTYDLANNIIIQL